MYSIVMIDAANVRTDVSPPRIEDSEPVYVSVKNSTEAMKQVQKFIGKDVILTHFWGTWDKKRVMFWCYDLMDEHMPPNKQATLAYLGECIPGTMHVICGPVVGLLDPELW